MILPSKKVLSIFLVCVALVISIIIAFGRDKASTAINYASNLVAGDKISIPENPNWQNELGEAGIADASLSQADSALENKTLTGTVAVSLISNYLALKQSGNLDQETAQSLVDQTANYIEASASQTITVSNLNVIPDNGLQTRIDYGDRLGMILKSNKPKEIKNEFTIWQEATTGNNSQKLEELQSVINIYKNMANEIKVMPVPQIFAKAHIDMVNGATGLATGLEEMKNVFEDPVRGLQGLQLYQNGGALFIQAIQASSEFIKRSNITYKQGSGGYYLLYGI